MLYRAPNRWRAIYPFIKPGEHTQPITHSSGQVPTSSEASSDNKKPMHSGTTKSHNYDLTVLTDKLINLTIQVQEMRLENITRRIQRGRSHYNRPGNRNYSRNTNFFGG